MKLSGFCLTLLLPIAVLPIHAADLTPIHEHCTISAGEKAGTFLFQLSEDNCRGERHCGNNMSDIPAERFTGLTRADLVNDGARLTATLTAEAGTLTCSGNVSGGELRGAAIFTPDAAFIARMRQLGFAGYDSQKLLAYALLNVESAWAGSLQQAGIHDLTIDNLLALRVFNVDPAYVRSITSLGYPLPTAENLIAMACQGVNAEEVKQIHALGYKPTFDELIQIRIFKITPDFIQRMQSRGFKDLTLQKLLQIRIFNLAD